MKLNAEFPGKFDHAVYNRDHSSFRVPGSQTEISIIHKTVKEWGIPRFCSQKKYRKFEYLL